MSIQVLEDKNLLDTLRQARELIDQSGSKALIEIDGGVNLDIGKRLVEVGADALVAGSFFKVRTQSNHAALETIINCGI